jgi:hypothetical protein
LHLNFQLKQYRIYLKEYQLFCGEQLPYDIGERAQHTLFFQAAVKHTLLCTSHMHLEPMNKRIAAFSPNVRSIQLWIRRVIGLSANFPTER